MVDLDALRSGDRRALARAITLLESTRADDRDAAEHLLRAAMPYTGGALRVGITGAPGVGKSTFIDAFGSRALERGACVAVLSIDPSSAFSGGSILGDKTRMHALAADPRAFIRPSPSGDATGGVARRTQEAILICEAAGFDLVLVETVGVGQSETMVSAMTDILVLLLLPTAGDALQGIKRGVMELADIVIVNKADGDLIKQAGAAAAEIQHALGLIQRRLAAWQPPVVTVSSTEGGGLDEAQRRLDECRAVLQANGALSARRQQQAKAWLWHETREQLLTELQRDDAVAARLESLLAQVDAGALPASLAARELTTLFMRAPMKSNVADASASANTNETANEVAVAVESVSR